MGVVPSLYNSRLPSFAMRYAYHDLYDEQFEDLVVEICAEILGAGVQPFSSGKDGGRDARFQGTARNFPNETAPLSGTFVVQAKHTQHPFARFSDSDFSSDADSSTLTEEIKRLKKLVAANELDHYLLFSNRRLAGPADEAIRKRIIEETKISSAEFFGIERMERLFKQFPAILDRATIAEVNAPLRVTSEDLAEVIAHFAQQKEALAAVREKLEIKRTKFDRKNEINGLSAEFAKLIKRTYLKDFSQVKRFLADPANEALQERYEDAAAEFNEQIVAHRDDFPSLDRALVYLQDLLFKRDGILKSNKRHTKLLIYYMYWNCDVGEIDDHA